MSALALLVDSTIRVSLLLALALAALAMFRGRSAAVRHWVLAVGLGCAAAAPPASLVVPGWTLEASWAGLASETTSDGVTTRGQSRADTRPGRGDVAASVSFRLPGQTNRAGGAPASPLPATVMSLIVPLWIAGAALCLALLASGLARLAWLTARARPVTDARWLEQSRAIAASYGLQRRVRLVESRHPGLLVAWGLFRPVVIVPAQALGWRDSRVRVVLAHELAHIARRDWPVQLLAELLRAACWFNPLVWVARRRLARESEQACDDMVLGAGADGPAYAAHLLAIARQIGRRPARLPATAMAAPSNLERRILAMITQGTDHTTASRAARVVSLAAGIALATVVAAAQAPTSGIHGQIVDQTGGTVPGVRVTLMNDAEETIGSRVTDVMGEFDFPNLAPGAYSVAASMFGFNRLVRDVDLGPNQAREMDLTLEIGSLQETVEISAPRSAPPGAAPPPPAVQPRDEALDRARQAVEQCEAGKSGSASPSQVVRVGGSVTPPRKLLNVPPRYPLELSAQGIEGVVVLEGIVSTEGEVQNIQVLREPHPGLGESAIESVSQWVYTPTFINCEAVEVIVTVTVRFGRN